MSPKEITEPITGKVRIIDLFSGMGGIRIGFEQAASNLGIECHCVFTSDIKPASVKAHKENWPDEHIYGDITKFDPSEIPDFDILLAGFPCQSFSQAGKRKGLNEARGTLFFDIANILREKKPEYFLLENVDNLAKHDDGKTLKIMNNILIKELDYKVSTVILDAIDFGVPQNRKRIYIIGSKNEEVEFESPEIPRSVFSDIMEQGLPTYDSEFTERVLELYEPEQLLGKKFKDKRGGSDNIHSWDLELRGPLTQQQKEIMRILLKQRRRKEWADIIGIKWMDGMPLTLEQIYTFYNDCEIDELKEMLDDLTKKTYLRFEHPKQQIEENGITSRKPDEKLPKGYNIVTGKLSFELNKIIDPKGSAPTIVATEADHIGVIDQGKIRKLSQRECLRLFGFPEDYTLDTLEMNEIYDLVGNTVVVNVVKHLAEGIFNNQRNKKDSIGKAFDRNSYVIRMQESMKGMIKYLNELIKDGPDNYHYTTFGKDVEKHCIKYLLNQGLIIEGKYKDQSRNKNAVPDLIDKQYSNKIFIDFKSGNVKKYETGENSSSASQDISTLDNWKNEILGKFDVEDCFLIEIKYESIIGKELYVIDCEFDHFYNFVGKNDEGYIKYRESDGKIRPKAWSHESKFKNGKEFEQLLDKTISYRSMKLVEKHLLRISKSDMKIIKKKLDE